VNLSSQETAELPTQSAVLVLMIRSISCQSVM